MRIIELTRSTLARIGEMLRGRQIAAELDEELKLHLELEVEHNIARGIAPADARRAAISAFGGVQRFREEMRDRRGFVALDALARDARFALRRLRRAPGFATGVVATLAVGLGAATGIGALVYGVMLRPLPYPDPDRLVRVSISAPGLGIVTTENSSGTFVFFQEQARSFAALGGYLENEGVIITDGESPERVTGAIMTPTLLGMLGVAPALGRLLRDDDALVNPTPVLLSHDLWTRRYGGDSAIVGKSVELNRRPRLVVGVLPRGFDFPSRAAAIYIPERIEATRAGLGDRYLTVVGRLRPGVTVHRAQSELTSLVPRFHERFPELSATAVRDAGLSVKVQTLRAAIVEPVRGELMLLAILVGVVLLIATTNVATLHLLRAERLRGEVAVSRALGASRARLTQRFVVEGVVVALIGALMALPIVAIAVTTKFGFTAGQVPRLDEVRLDSGLVVLLFAVATSVGIAIGCLAAARAGGGVAATTLRSGARATGGRAWRRVQGALVTVQIALALAVLLGAGLLGRSLARLHRVDIGFVPARGTTFLTHLPFLAYPRYQHTAAFHLGVIDSLRAVPGVTGAAAAMQFPLLPQLLTSHPRLEAHREDGKPTQAMVTANIVSPDFFSVMGIPLRAGRAFVGGDLVNPTPAIVISASLARELFGTMNPVGQQVRMVSARNYPPYLVVGVSGDVYGDRIADGVLRVVYFPLLPDLAPASLDTARIPEVPAGMHYVVRSELPLSALVPAFRRVLSSLDPRVPLWGVQRLDDIVAESTARVRLMMLLLGVAAAATLLLGAIGLYSVIAYAVAARTGEFAVRAALGATPMEIKRLVLHEGVVVASAGIIMGLGVSLAGARFLRGVLYDVSATDPASYAAAGSIVLAATLFAMYLPAHRAGQADPAQVLRGT